MGFNIEYGSLTFNDENLHLFSVPIPIQYFYYETKLYINKVSRANIQYQNEESNLKNKIKEVWNNHDKPYRLWNTVFQVPGFFTIEYAEEHLDPVFNELLDGIKITLSFGDNSVPIFIERQRIESVLNSDESYIGIGLITDIEETKSTIVTCISYVNNGEFSSIAEVIETDYNGNTVTPEYVYSIISHLFPKPKETVLPLLVEGGGKELVDPRGSRIVIKKQTEDMIVIYVEENGYFFTKNLSSIFINGNKINSDYIVDIGYRLIGVRTGGVKIDTISVVQHKKDDGLFTNHHESLIDYISSGVPRIKR